MSNLKNSSKASIFIDYIPAELKENDVWRIVYYVKNPFSKKLVRKRIRIKPMNSINERRKLGRRLVKNINTELEKGWNPFKTEKNAAAFKGFVSEINLFIKRLRMQLKKGDVRAETLKSYRSYANVIKKFMISNSQENATVYDCDSLFVSEFLDYIYYDCENSATTRNNYLSFLTLLFNYFKTKKYIGSNPCESIKRLPKSRKNKIILPKDVRIKIFNYLQKNDPNYLTLCLACFYCLIRRTELSKIKVGDVILDQNILYIRSETSKNKKTQPVTIPQNYRPFLENHIKEKPSNYFLFSADNYKAGPIQLRARKISNEWNKLRKILKFNYTWYDLKVTGITELLMQGVPTIKVRDQARHHSVAQTEEYTPKEILKAESDIQYNSNKF